MRFGLLIFESIRRNAIRSLLTAIGTAVLVLVVTLVWSILEFLQSVTAEKTSNFKAIVTERWRIPSQMPYAYAVGLGEGGAREPSDLRPEDSMTWTFYGGTVGAGERQRDSLLFAFCLQPEKLLTMMDELDALQGETRQAWIATVQRLQNTPQGIILGKDRMAALNKQIGERFTLSGLNYKGIDLEVEIVGVFPIPRYDQSAAINIDYFNRALFDAYPLSHNGQAHPMAEKSLNLVWLRVPDTSAFSRISQQVMESPLFANPSVKVETASSGIAAFLEAYRDLIWGMRWLMAPAIIVTLSLVISNAISISVRERRTEFALLKVIGFRPLQILLLVLLEALLIGAFAGVTSAGLTYYVVNSLLGGLKFPIAFFPAFYVSPMAPVWGVGIGAGAALVGSWMPAWQACRVRVAEVFGRVA